MACKRFLPMLRIQDGRVVDPGTGEDLGEPLRWARRLDLEGADELIIEDPGPGPRPWLAEVARGLFLPFALAVPGAGPADVAEALAAGADRVVLPAPALAGLEGAAGFGRTRLLASLEGHAADGGDDLLEACREAGLRGAGGVLLTLHGPERDLLAWCAMAAHLPVPLLLRCEDPDLAAEALAHGADGVAFPGHRLGASAFKRRAAAAGILTRS